MNSDILCAAISAGEQRGLCPKWVNMRHPQTARPVPIIDLSTVAIGAEPQSWQRLMMKEELTWSRVPVMTTGRNGPASRAVSRRCEAGCSQQAAKTGGWRPILEGNPVPPSRSPAMRHHPTRVLLETDPRLEPRGGADLIVIRPLVRSANPMYAPQRRLERLPPRPGASRRSKARTPITPTALPPR